MLELLKRAINLFDLFILAIAVYMFLHFDYANLSTMNIIYIVVFFLWLVMFFARIFIVYKNGDKR